MREAETRYARRDDLHIAYQVTGDGPRDLVLVSNWLSNQEVNWDVPGFPDFIRGLGSFARTITFDQLGTGLSDRNAGQSKTLEAWGEDLLTVLDAVGSGSASIVCFDASGLAGIFFAATYADKVDHLVLINCFPRFLRAPDYPEGLPLERKNEYIELIASVWGGMSTLAVTAPSVAADELIRTEWARFERIVLSPGDLRQMFELQFVTDVRDVLPSIRVPTLVVQSRGGRYVRSGHGRYLADHIQGAKYVEVDTEDHFFFFGDVRRSFLDEVQEFVTGDRPTLASNRTLMTLLFTDIVSSTEHAAEMGDQRWSGLLDRHDQVLRDMVSRHSGNPVKHTGDGFLASFDGPARAVRCALDATDQLRRLGVEIRSGLHTGEVEVRGEDLSGIAVHIARRIMDQAGASETMVSGTVKDLVIGSGLSFDEGRKVELKGIPDEWRIHKVVT